MSVSEVDVANSALAKLGDYRIISLNDNTREARLVKQQFSKIRDELLRAHPWKFATTRAVLALLPSAPAYGYTYAYGLPTDCIRVIEIDDNDEQWTVEGGQLLTDLPNACCKYVRQSTIPGEWEASFAEAFASKLAHDICYAVTQSASLKEQLLKEYQLKIQEARTFNAQEAGGDSVYAAQWLHSRY